VEIRYKRSHFAKLLGFTDMQLTAADKLPELKALAGGPASYQPRHLSAYRRVLDRRPRREPSRRQLFLNFKGGTGKTSLSVAYAYRLAERGHRVLLIDLDSQGHATQHLGLAAESLERTVFDTLVNGVPIEDVIVRTPLAEFDVLPANLRMTTIDISLMPMAGREYKLQRALARVLDRYEFIVMDAPPAFGLLNLNALMASDDLLVPVLPDFLSFHGLKLLFETLGQLEEDLNYRLQSIRIVLNQYNPTTRIAREAKAALESHYREFLSDTIVRQCTQFARASSDRLPINAYAPSCKGARDIDALITEMISARVERAMERSA
jgi:chromosome partitioning protein